MCNPTISVSPQEQLSVFLNDPTLGASSQQVAAGTVLFEISQATMTLFYLHTGQVRLYQRAGDGSERLVEIYGPGQWVGSEALAGRERHHHRAVVMEPTQLTAVSVASLMSHLPAHPSVAIQLVQQLAEKVQQAREDAGRLVFDDCNERLVKTLVRFSTTAAAKPSGQGVELHITHQQLAQAVGAARETVSLALTHLRQQNLLRTGRNRLMFNPDALKQFACQRSRAMQHEHLVHA